MLGNLLVQPLSTLVYLLVWNPLPHIPYISSVTQSVSSFHNTYPYHWNLFCCNINIISSIPSLSLNSLPGALSLTLTLHIRPFSSSLPSNRHNRSNGDFLESKRENYQVCSVQYCVQQLCTVQCTHLNRPNSSLDSFFVSLGPFHCA